MLAFKRLIPAALLAAAFAAPQPLWAQDIFIRPNTTSNNGPTVDYGVKARPQAQPEPPAPAHVQPAPAPPPVQKPVPQVQPPAPVLQQPVGVSKSSSGISVEKYGPGVSVVKFPPEKPPSPGKGPYTLVLNFKGGAIGSQDKETVMHTLGITEAEIQANCFLRYTVILNSGSGDMAILTSLATPSVQYKFAAPMEKISVYPGVTCRKLHPPVSGMTIEQGGYYITAISSATCEPGAKGNTSFTLDFTFAGDGAAQCVYQ